MKLLEQSDRSMLAKIAFYLCQNGFIPEAEGVFQGLAVSAPEKDGAAIGLALCLIIRDRCDEAVALLDARLGRGSDLTGQLSLYKLLALGMAGRVDDARALRADMQRAGLEAHLATADLLLEDLSKLKR